MESSFQDLDLLQRYEKEVARVKEVYKQPDTRQPPRNMNLKGMTAYDPMSPYEPPHTPDRFETITDVINNKSFKGSYPQSFTPVPEYFKKYGISPYYDPEDFTDYARGAFTIANMIELTFNNQPWQLSREQDIPVIIEIVEQYYEQMQQPGVADDIAVKAYKTKVEKFLNVMRKANKRTIHKYSPKDTTPRILSILKKFVGK